MKHPSTLLPYCCLMILLSCNPPDLQQWIDPASYYTSVEINGIPTRQGILLGEYKDSMLSFAMERTSSDDLYWEVSFSPFNKKTQSITLHKFLSGSLTYAHFYALCCIPPVAEWP